MDQRTELTEATRWTIAYWPISGLRREAHGTRNRLLDQRFHFAAHKTDNALIHLGFRKQSRALVRHGINRAVPRYDWLVLYFQVVIVDAGGG